MTTALLQVHNSTLVPLGTLVGAEYNPREMPPAEMAKLKRSLVEFGVVEPLVARREDRLIIGGHQRAGAIAAVLADMGQTPTQVANYPVPVIFLDGISDEKAKLLNVALNKIHGEWDYAKLASLFASVKDDLDPATIALSGFAPTEIDEMLGMMGDVVPPPPPNDDLDVDATLAAKARRFGPFEVATDAEAREVQGVLKAYGMTGPGNAVAAFLAMVRGAAGAKPAGAPQAPAEAKKPPRQKRASKGAAAA